MEGWDTWTVVETKGDQAKLALTTSHPTNSEVNRKCHVILSPRPCMATYKSNWMIRPDGRA